MSIEDLPAGVSVSEALGLEDASEYQVAYGNALRQVAASGDAAELRALLPNVEDVDACSSDGLTAFLLSCGNGQVECMEILRDAGRLRRVGYKHRRQYGAAHGCRARQMSLDATVAAERGRGGT